MVRHVFYDDDRTADVEFRTALAIDPKNALANEWYGNMLVAQGFAEEGVRHLQIAAAEQPIATATYAWMARGYYEERRYDQAVRYAREALAIEPTRLETIALLGLAQEAHGHAREAAAQFRIAGRNGASSHGESPHRTGHAARNRSAQGSRLVRRPRRRYRVSARGRHAGCASAARAHAIPLGSTASSFFRIRTSVRYRGTVDLSGLWDALVGTA
jgi:tetratricopeptide (TPR) repeat protein